jgi:zinc protease
MGYKVPVLNSVDDDADVYALEVLSGILSGGNSARLASNLIRGSQVASSASAGYDMNARLPTLFLFDGSPVQGRSAKQLEEALLEQIKQLQTNLVEEKELNRIKAQVIASSVYEKDSNFYQGMQLGMLETVGVGWHKADEYVDKVKGVTAQQLRDVAKKYLIEDHLTVVHMQPEETSNEN